MSKPFQSIEFLNEWLHPVFVENEAELIAKEFGRPIATARQAREILKIGVFYDTAEETLQANGFAPNRNGAQQGFLRKAA